MMILASYTNHKTVTFLHQNFWTCHLLIRSKDLVDASVNMLVVKSCKVFVLQKILLTFWIWASSGCTCTSRRWPSQHFIMNGHHITAIHIWNAIATPLLFLQKVTVIFDDSIPGERITQNTAADLMLDMFIKHIVRYPLLSILHLWHSFQVF